MKTKLILILLISFLKLDADACTNFLITPGASTLGRTYIFYSNDGAYAPSFPVYPAGMYTKLDSVAMASGSSRGYIPHARKEYHTIGYHMNEYNVSIGETTFGGRPELHNPDSFVEYSHLMHLGLRRSKTARQMIKVMTSLVAKYGYGSEGESFSIADPKEAWILEMIGKGKGQKGALWVALRIPDGYVAAHANHSRIGTFNMKDKKNVLYAPDVVSYAIKKGYYSPKDGKPFSFSEAYDPVTPAKLRYTEMRVWDFFHRVAPSQHISPDYARGVKGAKRMPLWIKPDKKLSLSDIMSLSRSHYDDTAWDMEKGYKAGAFGNPNRSGHLSFKVDGKKASWERPISTPLTAYAFVAELGGLKYHAATLWLGLDNTYTNIYMPFNTCVSSIPKMYSNTNYNAFSWKSLWWVFNFVGNYVNLRYVDMIKDVQERQDQIQHNLITKYRLLQQQNQTSAKEVAKRYDAFGQQHADSLLADWTNLANKLIVKYNDGLVRDKHMNPKSKGYSADFYRSAVKNEPKRILPVWK